MIWGDFLAANLWQFALLACLLTGSGFFSGTETALFNLSRGQVNRLRNDSRTGRLVGFLLSRPQRLLNTLLLGNMLVNIAYAAVTAVMLMNLKSFGASALTVAIASPLPLGALILLGEVTPKTLAYTIQERWAILAAWPVHVIMRSLGPVLWTMETLLVRPLTRIFAPRHVPDRITGEELGAVLTLSTRRGVLDHDANALLQEIVELTDLRVRQIMVPRVDLISWNVDRPREELVELFRKTRLRKIPVWEGSADNMLGVVHAKRLLLDPQARPRDIIASVPFVPEAANIERVLLQFRTGRTQMAIVVDEYGGTAGLVTLEDVLEEIVGDIPDPDEKRREPPVEKLGDNTYLLDGNLPIHEWVDAFKIHLSSRRISTIGGFLTSRMDRICREGDQVLYRNLRFRVVSMRGRRIGKVRLELLESAP